MHGWEWNAPLAASTGGRFVYPSPIVFIENRGKPLDLA